MRPLPIRVAIAKALQLRKTTSPMRRKATFHPVAGLFAGKERRLLARIAQAIGKRRGGPQVGGFAFARDSALLSDLVGRRAHFDSSAPVAPNRAGNFGFDLVLGARPCSVIVLCIPAPTRRAKRPSIHGSTTPSPNRSWRSPPPETSGSAQVRLSHPLFSGPPAAAFPGPTFVTLRL